MCQRPFRGHLRELSAKPPRLLSTPNPYPNPHQVVIHRDMVEERLRTVGTVSTPDQPVSSEEATDRENRRAVRIREEEERALLLRFGSHL